MTTTIGLDVGGAHLKVAALKNGHFVEARQILCPLWQGLDKLDVAMAEARATTKDADQIAITMTGELSDLFDTREQGVHTLVDRLQTEYGKKAMFWMGARGFGSAQQAKHNHADVGSTNFLATAQAVAQHKPNAILIDMGSTTTDIVPIVDGSPRPHGLVDAERLQSGELVYTGLTRTAVMAVTNRVPFTGQWQTIAREYLATMADIYRLLGELPDGADLHDTADGRGKSIDESLTRFARMLGRDCSDLTTSTADETGTISEPRLASYWKAAAQFVADEQITSIEDGAHQVLSAIPNQENQTVVTAGIGAHIATRLATRLQLPHIAFGQLVGAPQETRTTITHNAPAAAVAMLSATA